MKLLRLIANLGYGSRKEVAVLFRQGRITNAQGHVLSTQDALPPHCVRLDGEVLDPPSGMVLMMHKPLGMTCSRKDQGHLVYELLPARYLRRHPALSTIGRLDRDTSGLLLFTDNGLLLHQIIAPKAQIMKRYEVTLAQDLRGDEGQLFASGTLHLKSDKTPLAPAWLEVCAPRRAHLVVTEGRYHQVRRMFAATGNRVESLCRVAVGHVKLGTLPVGQWRMLTPQEIEQLFVTPCSWSECT